MKPIKHASDRDLALYAGSELTLWARLRVRTHLGGCERCRMEVDAYRETQADLKAVASDLPVGLDWDHLEREMRANIRVGLAAAACLPPAEDSDRHLRLKPACFSVLVAAGYWMTFWQPHKLVPTNTAVHNGVRLQTTKGGIELEENGKTLTLVSPDASPEQGQTFTVSSGDSMRARYVDSKTGQVTINHVYME